jgi:hypothetical protein
MVTILLILTIVLLFAALPILPYSASGRARYHVASVREKRVRAGAKLPQFSSGETLHITADAYISQLRALQNELQNALDQPAKSSAKKPRLSEDDRSRNSREQRAA